LDYVALANRTLSIITKYGTSITISYFSAGTYNAVEGSYSSATYTNIGTVAVFDTVSGLSGRQGLSGDSLQTILENKIDIVAYIPAIGNAAPTIADRIKYNGNNYEIIHLENLKPAGTELLYTIFLRKG
jgi:hypothetical protein